jgi:hypothetical protein
MEMLTLEAMIAVRGGILAVGNTEVQTNLLADPGSRVTVTPAALVTQPGVAIVQPGLVAQQAVASAGNL